MPTLTTARVVFLAQPRVNALLHVQQLVSQFIDVSPSWSLPCAAERGFVHLVRRWLTTLNTSNLNEIAEIRAAVRNAAANGYLTIIEILLSHYPQAVIDETLVLRAASNGHADVLRWLRPRLLKVLPCYEEYNFYSQKSVAAAAENGHLTVVQWLLDAQDAGVLTETHLHQAAARGGHLEVVKWLRTNLAEDIESQGLDEAAAGGFLDVVEFLHTEWEEAKLESNRVSCPATSKAMNGAASNGHVETVKWLHEYRDEGCTMDAMNKAAWNGHLAAVIWLNDNRTEGCTQQAMNMAAKGGHLDVVQFLHENRTEGCTYNAMDWAAQENHLEIVQWLHANRCEGCSRLTMNEVAKRGHFEMLKWLHDNRTEGCTVAAMNAAATHGHLDIVQFLHSNRSEGCTTAAMDGAAENNHLDIVQWLHHNRSEGYGAAARGDFVVLEWLRLECRQDIEEWPIDAGRTAVTSDRVEVLHWLLKHFAAPKPHRKVLYDLAQNFLLNRAHIMAYLDGYWTVEA
ncbi:uncharacterized protein PITG_11220 [Phytophthora infestans T30-4]|uniref:Uncharacterized protein n=1 Tax=Phytophthora infestans (strain T30-4) TaxID=403677 RepID=D0NGG8_PHYIT|nr:uncharacterized protein PITG_11220 [Phytophthora infestans T30-4]EEY57369.1 conserved hypothetical protein [Phytophthora infestans T30-4]|eukprot:XP_002901979.1 conserved hypothetical protein [Phytophthora infestans T30-4]